MKSCEFTFFSLSPVSEEALWDALTPLIRLGLGGDPTGLAAIYPIEQELLQRGVSREVFQLKYNNIVASLQDTVE